MRDRRPHPDGHGLSHLDGDGRASMVDVSDKPATVREATARGRVLMAAETLERIQSHAVDKGDVLAVARVAGILAAKQTHLLVPLCHPLALDRVTVRFAYLGDAAAAREASLLIEASVRTRAPTGAEMEALTAVQVAALTIYDMLKAIDREMVIGDVHVFQKSGGRSGVHVHRHPIPGLDDDADTDWL